MKRIFIYIVAALVFAGCNKFGDTNISPVKLTTASTRALLTNSQQAMSGLSLGNTAAARLGALYVQHLSEGPYPGPSLYNDRNLAFAGWYTGPLYDLQTIINYNEEGLVCLQCLRIRNITIAVRQQKIIIGLHNFCHCHLVIL